MDFRNVMIVVLFLLLLCSAGAAGFLYYQMDSSYGSIPIPEDMLSQEPSSSNDQTDEISLVEIPLYFQNIKQTQLVKVQRKVEPMDSVPQRMKTAMTELIAGPRQRGLVSPIPDGTELKSVFWSREERRVYVNFSDALVTNHPGHALSEWATIYAIVNTIAAQSPQVKEVQVLVNGQAIRNEKFNWDWSLPFKAEELFVEYEVSG